MKDSGARITMECLICGDSISTSDVDKAIAFDREHAASCTPDEVAS